MPVLDNGGGRVDNCAIHIEQEAGKRDALSGQRVIRLRTHDVGCRGGCGL